MSLFKNFLVVLKGSVLAQGISYLFLPVISRLFPPESFGEYQVFQSVLGVLLLINSLRYEVAILSAENDDQAMSIGRLCLSINVGMPALTGLVAWGIYLANPHFLANIRTTLWFLPVALLVGGTLQTLFYVLLRKSAFNVVSNSRGVQACSNTAIGLLSGWLGFYRIGLVFADAFGKLVATVFVYIKLGKLDAKYLFAKQTFAMKWALIKKFKNFPLLSLPGSLIDVMSTSAAPLLFFSLFGSAFAGQFALTERSISLPLGVISQAVSQVFMSSLSSQLRTNRSEMRGLIQKTVLILFGVAIVPTLLIALFGKTLFVFFLGAQWDIAGEIAEIAAPLFLISFVAGPINMTLLILEKQKINFYWYTARMIFVVAIWTVVYFGRLAPMTAVKLHVSVYVFSYIAFLFLVNRQINRASEEAFVS